VKELGPKWVRYSSLRQVVFESALSLRMMIETNKVDLSEGFEIKFVDYDCSPNLPGYYVETVSCVDDLVHFAKMSIYLYIYVSSQT
jgi:hypothetical protein